MKRRHLANKVTASHAIPIKTIQIFLRLSIFLHFAGSGIVRTSAAFIPVSYTHLVLRIRQNGPGTSHCSLAFIQDSLKPVSYTHLDVYKRQPQYL